MKKFAIFLLCFALLFTFVACNYAGSGGGGDNNGNNNGNNSSDNNNGNKPSDPPSGGDDPVDPPTGGDDPVDPPTGGDDPVDPPTGGDDPVDPPTGGDDPVDPPSGGDDPVEPLPAYKVTYESGNSKAKGTAPEEVSYAEGDLVTVSANTFTLKGYTFECWSDGKKTYHAGDTFTMPAYDVKLTAVWQEDDDPSDPVNFMPFSDEATAQNDSFYKKYSAEEKALYYLLWQETTTISIKIDISPYELAKIDEAFRSHNYTRMDTYRKCNLTITVNGTDYYYEEVGIRMRGNTSKRDFCDKNGNIYAFIHYRFSLSETFDGDEYAPGAWGSDIAKTWTDEAARAERKDRSFATMEKFYYKWNKNYDNTYMREVYANRMFRAYGILAPHITMVQVSLMQNGGYHSLGVGTLYETVDKQFLKRNFSKEERGGDLYKCGTPANFTRNPNYGVESPGTPYFAYSLKTNNDRSAPDYKHNKDLLAFIDMINSVDVSTESGRQQLEALVDMEYFTNFEAVNYLLGNPDCIRNNSNNFYIYFLPETGKMYLIPYDYDRCLGINVDWNPFGDGMTSVTPYSLDGSWGRTENPLYTKTILSSGVSYYQNMYQSKLQNVLDGQWFTYEHFQTMFNSYKANYASLVTPSALICQQCKVNVGRLEMSERGTTDLGSQGDNISTQLYMQLKRQTAENNLTNIK